MGWPDWLDAVEEKARRDLTCPDCYRVVGGRLRFAPFQQKGCRHLSRPVWLRRLYHLCRLPCPLCIYRKIRG